MLLAELEDNCSHNVTKKGSKMKVWKEWREVVMWSCVYDLAFWSSDTFPHRLSLQLDGRLRIGVRRNSGLALECLSFRFSQWSVIKEFSDALRLLIYTRCHSLRWLLIPHSRCWRSELLWSQMRRFCDEIRRIVRHFIDLDRCSNRVTAQHIVIQWKKRWLDREKTTGRSGNWMY